MRHFNKRKKEFLNDLSAYINTYLSMRTEEHSAVFSQAFEAIDDYFEKSISLSNTGDGAAKARKKEKPMQICGMPSIVLPEKKPTFQQNLFAVIDSRGLKDSAVYKKADIDRRLFSKIRADVDYHPSKATAVKLCLALELDIAETERLLETAGYCLSLSDTADLVVRYCIEHKIYRLIDVNEALDYFGQEVLK